MMREYKRYDEYKDSGVEWIGTIPNEWDVERFRTLTKNIQNGKWGEEAQNNSDDIYCVRVADYNREKNIVEDQEFTIRNLDKSSREELLLEKDDLLLEKSGGGDKQPVGFVAQYKSEKPAIYANFMAKIEPRKEYIKTDYLKYVNVSVYQKREILKVINQTTGIQNLDTKRYLEIECPLPSKSEQQKIASYLDQKTTEIDKIINKKEKLIDNLEKYKKSVITEAVTKGKLGDKYLSEDGGLVDEIEMKDSGVEWIGEIPEYSDVIPFKRISIITSAKRIHEKDYRDKGIPFYRSKEVARLSKRLKAEARNYISKELFNKIKNRYGIPEKGDILITSIGTIGQVWVCDGRDFYYKDGNITQIILESNNYINSKFIKYCFDSNLIKKQYKKMSAGSTLQALTIEKIKELIIIQSNKKIKTNIVNYLDNKIQEINNLINKTKESIEKYKEYKKSLIFEAVTGKIDLRDYELEGGEKLAEHNNSSETERKRLSAVD